MVAAGSNEAGGTYRRSDHREMFWQLVRFGIAGGLATAIYTVVYWPVATYGHHILHVGSGAEWPLVGNVLGYLAAMVSGYFLHSRWSF